MEKILHHKGRFDEVTYEMRAIDPRGFEEHKLTCRNRPVKCATCAVEFPFTDVDAHERACPEKTVACQFCGESMKRKALGKPPRHINGTASSHPRPTAHCPS